MSGGDGERDRSQFTGVRDFERLYEREGDLERDHEWLHEEFEGELDPEGDHDLDRLRRRKRSLCIAW